MSFRDTLILKKSQVFEKWQHSKLGGGAFQYTQKFSLPFFIYSYAMLHGRSSKS